MRYPFVDLWKRADDGKFRPLRSQLLFWADFLLVAVKTFGILGLLAIVAWKTLTPIPGLCTP